MIILLAATSCEKTAEPEAKAEPAAPKAETTDRKKEWKASCEALLKEVQHPDRAKAVDVKYVDGHLEHMPTEAWKFKWHGIEVPIPNVEYDSVLFDHGFKEGQIEIILEGPEALVSLTFDPPSERSHQELATRTKFHDPSLLKVAWKESFGRHDFVRSMDLFYSNGSADAKCGESAEDVLLLYAFSTHAYNLGKSAMGQSVWKAFQSTHASFPLIIARSTANEKEVYNWQVFLVPKSVDDTPQVAAYGVAPEGPHAQIGRRVGGTWDLPKEERPAWFSAMENVVADFSEANVDALEEAFDGTGVKTKGTIGELRALAKGETPWEYKSKRKRQKAKVTF